MPRRFDREPRHGTAHAVLHGRGPMTALATDTMPFIDDERNEPIRVWIEHADGSISRGRIRRMCPDTAVVQLAGATSMAAGEAVAVRIAYNPGAPTLGVAARVTAAGP